MAANSWAIFFLACTAFFSGSSAQTVLGSYTEVRDALVNGHAFVAAVVDLGKCTVSGGDPNATTLTIYTDQLNSWRIVESTDSGFPSYIYNEQYYLQGDGYWIIAEIVLDENDVTYVVVHAADGATLTTAQIISWECGMGDGGAQYIVRNAEVTEFDGFADYNRLKAALILGRHMFATVNLNDCDQPMEGLSITAGFFVDDWQVSFDGGEDEVIAIVAPWRLTQNAGDAGSEYAVETAIITIRPNNRVEINAAVLDAATWENETPNNNYECNLGSSMNFFAPHDDLVEYTYQTYQAVSEALFTGHELELVLFGRYCDWNIEEGQRTNLIYGHRFYNWDWEMSATAPGPQDYINFEDVLITPGAGLVDEDYRVLEDGTVVFDTVVYDLSDGGSEQFRALCPLGTGAVFRGALREADPLTTFAALETAVLAGKPVIWEAYLPNCTQGAQFQPGYLGGTFVQTFDIYDQDRMFYAPDTNVFRNDFFDGQVFWAATAVVVYESTGVVGIYPSVFDAGTWENVTPPDLLWECQLGESAWLWGENVAKH